jgi:RNA polymerase sigma factor for flagellar operon FliA
MKRRLAGRRGLSLILSVEREEASHWRRFAVTRDGRLRERLFERYVGFAKALARRHARRSALRADMREDLEQLAYRGLLEAIDRFDPARGSGFLGFAKPRINGSIVDGIGTLDEDAARVRFRVRRERERLMSLTDNGEIKPAPTQRLSDLVTELALGLMLEQTISKAGSPLVGNSDNGFDNLAWRETQALLGQRVGELPEPEQTVVRQHYLNGLLFVEIAAMLGLTKGRVSQLHSAALIKLRKSMKAIR